MKQIKREQNQCFNIIMDIKHSNSAHSMILEFFGTNIQNYYSKQNLILNPNQFDLIQFQYYF